MRFLGKHKQSFDLMRTLAITCHALDLSGDALLAFGTYDNKTTATKEAYDTLLSTNLLHLAVAIRTNIYQGLSEGDSQRWVRHCGFLDVDTMKGPVTRDFTIKDVCDKIIHADEIYREPQESVEHARSETVVCGNYRNEKWELSISIALFCEVVLNWLDEVEQNILKADNPLSRIHQKAEEAGLDKITDVEIEAEIKAARKSRAEKTKRKPK